MPVALWALLIWLMSGRALASTRSAPVIEPWLRWLFPHVSPKTIELLHLSMRKGGHVVEYFIFSMLVLRAVGIMREGWKLRAALTALAMAAIYAGVDEIHQVFVPGRGASIRDALLDIAAAVLAQVCVWLWLRHKTMRAEGVEFATSDAERY
jgi:VanZ family protein